MRLRNLIVIADNALTVALYIRTNKGQYRYNFENKTFDSDLSITPAKLSTVQEFRTSEIYKKLRARTLISWSTLMPENCKGLVESNYDTSNISRGIILSISVDASDDLQGSTTIPKKKREYTQVSGSGRPSVR